MKEKKGLLSFLIKYFIPIVFLIIMAFYCLSCFIYLKQAFNYKIIISLFIIIALWLFLGFLTDFIINKNSGNKKIYIICFIFIFSVIIYSLWNIFCNTQPVSDYEVLINGAKSILKGEFQSLSFNKENYFYFYNFQISFVIYLATIMKLIGTSIFGLKFIEIIVLSISNVMVYLIVSKITNEKIGIYSALIYSTLVFNISGSSIINNQHISMLFILFSLYFFIKDEKNTSKFYSGLFISIAIILRSSSVIYLIAMICYLIYIIFRDNFKNYLKQIIFILIIICTWFAFTRSFDFILVKTKFVPNSVITSNLKYFKFVLGIQSSGITGSTTENAEKTQIYYDLKSFNYNYDDYNNASKEYLLDRYKNHTLETLRYIKNKMEMFSGYPDNQIDFALTGKEDVSFVSFIKHCSYSQYLLLIIVSFIASLKNIKNHGNYFLKSEYILFLIIFIGFFLVHIFIEVQTRYRFDQYLFLSIIVSPLLLSIINKTINDIKIQQR